MGQATTSGHGPAGLHVVLGATGGIGGALVEELARRCHPVRAVNRAGSTVAPAGAGWFEAVAADASDPAALARAVAGAAVVHHAAQPAYTRWPQEFPLLTARIADAAQAEGAVLVMADNLYGFGAVAGGFGSGTPAGPMTEDTPLAATDAKGRVRIAMEQDLLARHRAGRLRVALGKASDYYGPGGANSTVAAMVVGPLAAGRAPRWAGTLDAPHTLHPLADVAAGLVTLAEHDRALGHSWVLPAPPPLTGRQLLALAAELAGRRVAPRVMSVPVLRLGALFVPMAREMLGIAHQYDRPFVVDAARFAAAFGPLATTPHEQALAATLAAAGVRPAVARVA